MRQVCIAAPALLLGCADLIEGAGRADGSDTNTTGAVGSDSTAPTMDVPPPTSPCAGADDITDTGVVGASSIFSGYPPILAVDGDITTSWLSTGDGLDPDLVVFSWNVALGATEADVAEIHLTGNGDHRNPAFREGSGFDAVTIVLLGDNDDVLVEEQHALAGTPDPALTVNVDNIVARRIELHFTEREDPDAGGFAELTVCGTAD